MTLTHRLGQYRGWPHALRLANDLVEVIVVPSLGGRVMAFGPPRRSLLWVNPSEAGQRRSPEESAGNGSLAGWKNYGGAKAWPAPQGRDGPGQWPGPPDALLDSGRYACAVTESMADRLKAVLVSPPDPDRLADRAEHHPPAGHDAGGDDPDLCQRQ